VKPSFHPSRDEIEALMGLAEENLKLARLEYEQGFPRAVVSKAYFVFLDMARAALLSRGLITRSHGGCVTEFGRVFVNTGEVSADYGRWFNRASRARQEADYEALKSFSAEEAQETLEQAQRFYDEMRVIVSARLDELHGAGAG
jgi:uncharacterized protein (UPF0332 family)